MKTKQIILIAILVIICNYLAYYFGIQVPEYYTDTHSLLIAGGTYVFLMLSLCADLAILIFGGIELYDYLGK
jgi:hypothetical protein